MEIGPAGPICPLNHLSFSFLQFADLWSSQQGKRLLCLLQSSPEPQLCPGPVLWGRDTSCMQEQRARQSHPCTKHTCTEASAVCQVSAPLPEEVKLQEGWEKPWGTVEGGTQGSEELQPEQSHSHSCLSRLRECKGPLSQIQQGKGHEQPLRGRSGSQLCVLWPWYTLSWPQH